MLLCLLLTALTVVSAQGSRFSSLRDKLESIAASCPGRMGVALIVDNADTLTVGNTTGYPLMSVFKLHQAIALCAEFDRTGASLDTVICLRRDSLEHNTWSPMLKEHKEKEICVSVRELLRYALTVSDNNASNVLFSSFVSVAATDSIIARMIPRESFSIAVSEAEMQGDHSLATANHSSPLGVAELMNRVFTDSLVSREKQDFIRDCLYNCGTGVDRISAPLDDKNVRIAHKTGSGYRSPQGILAAHNDAAYITLPDGRAYSLTVLVQDFDGDERQASDYISRISEAVYTYLTASAPR